MHGPSKYTVPVTFSRGIKQDSRYCRHTEDFQWSRHPSLRADPFRLSTDGRFALHFVRQRLQRRSLQDSGGSISLRGGMRNQGDWTQQITSLDTFSINYILTIIMLHRNTFTYNYNHDFGMNVVANRFHQLGSEAGVPPELGHLWYQQSSAMSCTRGPLVCCETCYSFGFNWKYL